MGRVKERNLLFFKITALAAILAVTAPALPFPPIT